MAVRAQDAPQEDEVAQEDAPQEEQAAGVLHFIISRFLIQNSFHDIDISITRIPDPHDLLKIADFVIFHAAHHVPF